MQCVYCIGVGRGYAVLGLRQKNTCRNDPLQVNFLDDVILHCLLLVLSFYAFSLLLPLPAHPPNPHWLGDGKPLSHKKDLADGHENLLHIRVALLRVVMTQDVSSENYNICFRRARNCKDVILQRSRGFDTRKQSYCSLMILKSAKDFFKQKEPYRLQLANR